ncbi:hypothetical protein MKX01_007897 [Papaver californicum]|nr:hypothetical protein MKX01_007897 [Papaver californicum]
MSDVNVSVRREEREDSNLLTSRLKIHSGDIPDCKLLHKQTGVLQNDLPNCSSQDKTVPSSCSVTWDEKVEIVKPISQHPENTLEELGAVSEFQLANPERDKPESASDETAYPEDILTSPINSYPDDSLYYDSSVPESLLDVDQSDAVRTELDNCAAACKMVSESEADSEHQVEKAVVNPTSSNLERIERECRTSTTFELNAQSSDSSDVQLHVSNFSSNKQTFSSCSEAASSDLVHAESLPTISIYPEPDSLVETVSCLSTNLPDHSGVNNFGSDLPGFSVPSSKASSDDKIINSVCESPVSPSTKDLVHEESLPAISMCPKPSISLEVESCSSTDMPDVSRVNNFRSARSDSSSPGFNVPRASSGDKIINSVCESQVSPSTKDLVHEESLPAISMCPKPDISFEVESCSSTDIADVSRVNNFRSARSDSSSPGFNVPRASSDDKIINYVCESQVSPSTKDLVHEDSLPAISMCPKPDISLEVESSSSTDILDVSRVNDFGSARTESSSSGFDVPSSKALPDDKISNNVCEFQVSPPTISGGLPTLFWTNGDLLGLEPAKPSDSSVLNLVEVVDKCASTSCMVMPNAYSDERTRKQDMLNFTREPINKSPSVTEKPNAVGSNDLTLVSRPSPAAHIGNNEQSSSAHGLSDRFSVNIFRRSYTSAPLSSLASGLMKLQETQFSQQKKLNRKAHQASPLPSPKRQFEHGSPVNSVSSSSPPLEHMTISFQPIDGFETSKLKLRFPDGRDFHDNRHVMLPSFQLVPEPSNSQRDIDYRSDDDTFSRLSDYLSDDIRSQHSYSNSEQWETDETPRGEDRDIYDGLRRVLSEESISSSEQGGSVADSLSSLPNFDSVIPIRSQEERESDGRDVDYVLNHPNGKTAPTDPPTERIVKPPYDVLEDKQDTTSEAVIDLNYMQSLQPTTLQQFNPAPFRCNEEATTSPPKSKNLQKLNGIEDMKNTIASEDHNGEEDLLQQIRTRSLNLKRTVPTKPILKPNPTANSKVTAILEKASAIHQVVGSDEGEDSEGWSDQ